MHNRKARVRSVRSATRGLTLRLIAERPGQVILVCIVCTIAIATGVIAHVYAVEAAARLESVGERRHGSISVVTEDEVDGEPGILAASSPAVSHAPGRRLIWFSDSLAQQVEEAARTTGTSLLRRIEIAAYDSDGTIRTVLAVDPKDPGLELIEPGALHRSAAPRELTVAIARRPDEPVEWHAVPDEVVYGMSDDGTVWVRYSWARSLVSGEAGAARGADSAPTSIVGASPVANVLVAAERATSPFSVAYDLSQQLLSVDAATHVLAWPELVGYERYVGTGSAAALLRPLALAVAAVGVIGAVAVATRNRIRDAVLLRTIGFETGVIRGVYVREIAFASIAATFLMIVGLLVASRFGLSVRIDAQVRRTLLGGALLPPMVAFLTVHRHLRAPLARIRRESGQ